MAKAKSTTNLSRILFSQTRHFCTCVRPGAGCTQAPRLAGSALFYTGSNLLTSQGNCRNVNTAYTSAGVYLRAQEQAI